MKIIAGHMAEKSDRQIARELKKSNQTVALVVNALVKENVIEGGNEYWNWQRWHLRVMSMRWGMKKTGNWLLRNFP
jgi:hypothetical protein